MMEHHFVKETIESIYDLETLKKYACPKIQNKREWYLECISCKKKCRAGLQAEWIVNTETKPMEKKEESVIQQVENKKKQEIIDIFTKEDPIRYLLETSPNTKPQSIYQRVNYWRRVYPDLEEKFHMIEKVRFLWSKPWDSMKVPDILKEMYPDSPGITKESKKVDVTSMHPSSIVSDKPYKSGVTLKHEVREESPTAIAPNSKIFTVKPSEENAADDISLEDFLADVGDIPETEEVKEEKLSQKEAPVAMQGSGKSDMDILLKKLQEDKKRHEDCIKELNKQIEAIFMVQSLLQTQ